MLPKTIHGKFGNAIFFVREWIRPEMFDVTVQHAQKRRELFLGLVHVLGKHKKVKRKFIATIFVHQIERLKIGNRQRYRVGINRILFRPMKSNRPVRIIPLRS